MRRPLLAGRTLRTRLTILVSTAVLVACAAVGLATDVAIHSFLISRLDQQITLAGSRYAVSLEHNDHDADNKPETTTVGQAIGTLGARLLQGHITNIGVVSDSTHPLVVSADGRAELEAVVAAAGQDGGARAVSVDGLGDYRVQVTTGADGDVLVTGLPLESLQETMDVLLWTEIIVFLSVAVVIGLLGRIAVRRALRPLERVAATALRVSELPLASGEVNLPDRVPGADDHTEVGRVASAVNHMLTRIEVALTERQASENRLRQFVADASHELRTPLAVVRSHAELIALEADAFSSAARDSLRSMESGTRRMSRLVDDLLLLARLDSGLPLEREQVDLTRVALDAVADSRVAAADHHWILELPAEPLVVIGDEQRLHQVMANLLANTRLHTPPGTTVTVSLSVVSPDGVLPDGVLPDGVLPDGVLPAGGSSADSEMIRVAVVDDGPGVPPDLLPHIAERFVRGAGHPDRASGSSGLGLAIVTGVVTAHGGSVSISSRPGRTAVQVELPRA
ncbi:two-component system OmpR family sensor kinase [Nakamurella sp. UYEF19]|uniref:sensor histidine kinase n=1 Tax=Nakamurella sp. UYEF19 TaxID=1756392 RepID=UPI003392332F